MSTSDAVIGGIGVVLLIVAIAGLAFLLCIPIRSDLRRRANQRERLLSEARVQMHTHEAMSRLYEVARQAQSQRPRSRNDSL